MEELVDQIITMDFEDLDGYENRFPIDERFGLVINYNDVKYEFLIHFKSNADKVYCIGSGALTPNDMVRFKDKPVFKRQSWDSFPEMNASTIFYNDPTRYKYPNLHISWGIGTPDDYFLENIGKILDNIFKLSGIRNSDVVFYSSSGGGFMSIQLATMLPDSVAWADIPQTNIRNFSTYPKTVRTIFEDESNVKDHLHRFDCIEYIKKVKYVPKIYLVMSCGFQDVFYHDIPFIDSLRKLDYYDTRNNKLKILINPKRNHSFLNRDQFFYLMKEYSHFDNFEEMPDLAILKNGRANVFKQNLEENMPLYKDDINRLIAELENLNILFNEEQAELIDELNEITGILESELDR